MHLTLFIPDLLPPDADAAAQAAGRAPALRRLLGRGTRTTGPAVAAEIWLCQACAVEQREDWPVAALTAAVDGLAADGGWWLRTDPLHQQLQRSGNTVMAAPALAVTAEEAAALCSALNTHFAADNLHVIAPHPQRWYLQLPDAAGLATPLLSTVAGRALPRDALQGSRASHWHRVLTEAQMVLHEHPVNLAREARGATVINSLLLWGGGRQPAVPGRPWDHLWADDALATALALRSGATAHPVPAGLADWRKHLAGTGPGTHHCVMIDAVHHAARYGSHGGWLAMLDRIDQAWFGPLAHALRHGLLQRLDVVATGPAGTLQATVRRNDLLKFWRSAAAWPALARAP